jgi:hypothetical protein
MSFERTERIIALPAALVEAVFPQLRAQFGEDLSDGQSTVRTIGAHWDDVAKTCIRAASFPHTIIATPLTTGELAFRCLWQADLAAVFDAGQISGARELTLDQLMTLDARVSIDPEPTEK